jgi:hypothetical protein
MTRNERYAPFAQVSSLAVETSARRRGVGLPTACGSKAETRSITQSLSANFQSPEFAEEADPRLHGDGSIPSQPVLE